MEKALRPPPQKLTDQALVEEVQRLARLEQRVAVALVAHLVELDRRQLHVAAGYGSIFDYCLNGLQLSEDAAYNRMVAARAARRFPLVLELLASGALHLTAVRLLDPYLTPENHREVLEAARHQPDLAAVFDQALELLVAKLEKQKNGATDRPRRNPRPTRPGSRHVPAEVKRGVDARDGGQCTYVGPEGRRCTARSGLHYHHIVAYARGGAATLDNISLRCRCHNQYEAEQSFGPWRGPPVVRESAPRYGPSANEHGLAHPFWNGRAAEP